MENIDLIKVMIKVTDRLLGRPEGTSEKLITYVTDRAVTICVTLLIPLNCMKSWVGSLPCSSRRGLKKR